MGRPLLASVILVLSLLVWACGDTEIEREGLPDGFPDDLPVYKGAHIIESRAAGNTLVVRFETDALRQDVTDFYRDAMDRPPWHTSLFSDQVVDEASSLDFHNPDKTVLGTVEVSVPRQSGKTTFTVEIAFRSAGHPTDQPAGSPGG